jgi:hypothetical protein
MILRLHKPQAFLRFVLVDEVLLYYKLIVALDVLRDSKALLSQVA